MSVDELAPLAGHGTAPPRDHSSRRYTEHDVEPGLDGCYKWFGIRSKRAIVRLTVLLVIAVALGFAVYAAYSGIEVLLKLESRRPLSLRVDRNPLLGGKHESETSFQNTQSPRLQHRRGGVWNV